MYQSPQNLKNNKPSYWKITKKNACMYLASNKLVFFHDCNIQICTYGNFYHGQIIYVKRIPNFFIWQSCNHLALWGSEKGSKKVSFLNIRLHMWSSWSLRKKSSLRLLSCWILAKIEISSISKLGLASKTIREKLELV